MYIQKASSVICIFFQFVNKKEFQINDISEVIDFKSYLHRQKEKIGYQARCICRHPKFLNDSQLPAQHRIITYVATSSVKTVLLEQMFILLIRVLLSVELAFVNWIIVLDLLFGKTCKLSTIVLCSLVNIKNQIGRAHV